MNKKVTLFFTFRNYNKVKDSDVYHYLILKLLPHNKQTKTSYSLPPKHWDKKAQNVKRRYWDLHPELVKQLNTYKDKFAKYYPLLESGEINPNIVCSEILHTRMDYEKDLTLIDYIKENKTKFGTSSGTVNKHIYNVKGVERALNNKTSITLNMLKNDSSVMEIVEALRKYNLKNTTRKGYMNTLDLITRKALAKEYHSPFKDGGYLPKKAVSETRVGVKSQVLLDGLEKIQTYKDIEAYLLWLYSFALQGMDVVDIANIDESSLVSEDGNKYNGELITHFHPFGDLIGAQGAKHLSNKWYLSGARAKSSGQIDGLYNLYPTLFIRDWLHYIMQITSPNLVYKGKDRLRLFNTKTRNIKGNEIEGAVPKISVWRDYLVRRMNKLFGVGLQHSRHTYTQIGKRYFGYSEGQMDYQLNHSVKGMSNTYQKGEDAIEIRDYRHHQLINHFEINDILYFLHTSTFYKYKKANLIYYKKEKAIPSTFGKKSPYKRPFEPYNNDMLIGYSLLQHNHTSQWTSELQKEYDLLVMDVSNKPIKEMDERGLPKSIYLTPDHPKYPKRILELNEIRKRAFGNFPITVSEGGGIALTEKALDEALQQDKNDQKVKEIIKN